MELSSPVESLLQILILSSMMNIDVDALLCSPAVVWFCDVLM